MNTRLALASCVVAFLMASPALAISLAPGQTVDFSTLPVSAADPTIASKVDTIGNFMMGSTVRQPASGGLTFEYSLRLISGSIPNSTLQIGGFANQTIDLTYEPLVGLRPGSTDNGIIVVTSISRSADGNTITIAIPAQTEITTDLIRLHTDSAGFASDNTAVLSFAGTTDVFSVDGPAAIGGAVPEPAAIGSLGLLAGVLTWRRRKAPAIQK